KREGAARRTEFFLAVGALLAATDRQHALLLLQRGEVLRLAQVLIDLLAVRELRRRLWLLRRRRRILRVVVRGPRRAAALRGDLPPQLGFLHEPVVLVVPRGARGGDAVAVG